MAPKILFSSKRKNTSLDLQGSISSRCNRETKCKASLLHLHYLPAHFSVSPPLGKSRRATHNLNGQLVSKCSLSTNYGPRAGCHSLPQLRRGGKKLFKACTLQPEGPSSNSNSITSCLWPRAGYFNSPCFNFLIHKWDYYGIGHMCLWKLIERCMKSPGTVISPRELSIRYQYH